MRHLRLISTIVILAAILSACRPGFPTEKFVRLDGQVNSHLIFLDGGRWEGYTAGNLITFGEYRTDGSRLLIDSDLLCEQVGAPVQAVYTWAYAGDQLTLTPEGDDGCAERRELFSAGPYTRSQ